MTRDSHTPIQVDIPGPKCLPPGLSLKKKIFGSNIGYEVRAVSHFLMVYCKKNDFIVFPYDTVRVLSEPFLYANARFWQLEKDCARVAISTQSSFAHVEERDTERIPKPVNTVVENA